MRRLLFAVIPFVLAALASAAEAAVQPVESKPQVRNIAKAFADFWEASKDKPKAEQLAGFKARVASGFPGFYSIERVDGDDPQGQWDARVEGAITDFPAIRGEYLRKTQQFETELPKHVATFKAWFPDYRQSGDIYVLHSLGEMDGGMRTIGGKNYLIFGVDAMVKYHGAGNESAFFHHELFHTYHLSSMGSCGDRWPIWTSLWLEGLATYVSKAMNPDANDNELLLELPDGMAERTKAVLPAALEQLEKVLDSEDGATYSGLFLSKGGDNTGLPRRRGYYLGYLVATQAAKTHSVQELASLKCEQVRDLVHSSVRALRDAAH
jgi:hypothetical protein